MIFDKDLDESLSQIIMSDTEKRDEIIQFLERIPDELLDEIREILDNEDELGLDENEDEDRDAYFHGNCVGTDGTLFSYNIDYQSQEKSLTIQQNLSTPADNDTPYIDFGVELLLVKEYLPYEMEIDEEVWIGTFTNSINVVGDIDPNSPFIKEKFELFFKINNGVIDGHGFSRESELEYHMIKRNSGYEIERINFLSKKRNIMSIDIKQVPTDLTFSYIDNNFKGRTRKLEPPRSN